MCVCVGDVTRKRNSPDGEWERSGRGCEMEGEAVRSKHNGDGQTYRQTRAPDLGRRRLRQAPAGESVLAKAT